MMGRTLIILSLISILIATISANCTAARTAIRLTDLDNGRTVDLTCGSVLEISLKGNPTTGYSWEVNSIDPTILKQIGEAEFIPSSQALGSGGVIILRFQTIAKGSNPLTLIYHRAFEKNVAPIGKFEIVISIN